MLDRPAPHPSSELGREARRDATQPALAFQFPDLAIPDSDALRLRRGLVAAHIELALPQNGVGIHQSLVECVRECLSGRAAAVWQEDGRLNMSFGAFEHAERAQVEAFAGSVAEALGATVVLATTVGLVVAADASFLR